jgi:hypothetical protein
MTSAWVNFRAYQVVEETARIIRLRGKPQSIRVDNNPKFRADCLTIGISSRQPPEAPLARVSIDLNSRRL